LVWFRFYDTQLKTALMMTKTNRDLLADVFLHSAAPVACYHTLPVLPVNMH